MDEKKQAITEAVKILNKKYGASTIIKMEDVVDMKIEGIDTGSVSLNKVFGCGGLPRGRIVEMFGQESCLSGDAFISYHIRGKNGKSQNAKGGTLEHFYKRFNNFRISGKGNYQRKETIGSDFFVSSINENNAVVKNKVLGVVATGEKECFKIKTQKGFSLTCTKDHKFYVGNGQYVALEDLVAGSKIFVHDNTPYKERKKDDKIYRKECFVKFHSTAKKKIVNGSLYYRVRYSHVVYEAFKNNLTPENYIKKLNSGNINEIKKMYVVPNGFHIHHINTDPKDDRIENLELLSGVEHNKRHAEENKDKLSFVATEDIIKSITSVGIKKTYDIQCQSPYNNYVANKIIVHNCGKSSMALFFVAQVQKQGGTVVWIDAEHSFDAAYSEKIGVDVKHLLVSQPDTAEETLDIISNMTSSGAVDLIVVDSVAAMVPKKEFEGSIEDETMALLARVMSRGMNMVSGIVSKTKTCVIFINQVREKVGVFWGPKTVTPGGKALKFFSSVRLEVKKGMTIKKGDAVIGNRLEICAVKNKVGFPFRTAELDLIYEKGIDTVADLLDTGVATGIIKLTGRTYEYGDVKLGTSREPAKRFLEENKEVFDKIKKDVFSNDTIKPKESTERVEADEEEE